MPTSRRSTVSSSSSTREGDPAETANGDLYEAMGYVRDSERSSGLSRKRQVPVVAAKA